MMKRVLKNQEIVESPWQLAGELANDKYKPNSIVPAQAYLDNPDAFTDKGNTAIWFDSDEDIVCVRDHINSISIIALNFPVFTDGRPYSSAHLLRTRFDFKGELRAIGDVRFDQLEQMLRSGFDTFELRDETELQRALTSLKNFSYSYQDISFQQQSYQSDAYQSSTCRNAQPILNEERYASR